MFVAKICQCIIIIIIHVAYIIIYMILHPIEKNMISLKKDYCF